MKAVLYAGLAVGLVPVQTTVLAHASVAGVRPDLCLVATTVIGLFGGPVAGALMGGWLGFEQDLFSAGEAWLNLMTKAGSGLAAGLAGRYVTHATPIAVVPLLVGLSVGVGIVFLTAGAGRRAVLDALRLVLLPQAVFDVAIGVAVYWILAERLRQEEGLG